MEKLYADNRGLVFYWVRRYLPLCADRPIVDAEDLAQAGFLGLCDASVAYDTGKGAAWSTWASYYIRNAMRDALGLRKSSPEPLVLSLDDAAYKGDDDLDGVTLGDTIADESLPDIDESLLVDDLTGTVRAAIDTLEDERHRIVLHGICDCVTYARMAKTLGISIARVEQIKKDAFKKMRRVPALKESYADDLNFISRKSASAFHRDLTSDTERIALRIIEREQRRGTAGT